MLTLKLKAWGSNWTCKNLRGQNPNFQVKLNPVFLDPKNCTSYPNFLQGGLIISINQWSK